MVPLTILQHNRLQNKSTRAKSQQCKHTGEPRDGRTTPAVSYLQQHHVLPLTVVILAPVVPHQNKVFHRCTLHKIRINTERQADKERSNCFRIVNCSNCKTTWQTVQQTKCVTLSEQRATLPPSFLVSSISSSCSMAVLMVM